MCTVLASIPQISLLLGPCAGGAAYSPALTDLVIMVEKQSYMFLTGPEVIRAVTGEVVDAEQLGGANVHISTSGLAHFVAPSEQDALPAHPPDPGLSAVEPPGKFALAAYGDDDPDPGRRSTQPSHPVGPQRALCYADGDRQRGGSVALFSPCKAGFARNAIVGLARMGGQPVGIVAQDPMVLAGALDIDASDKITRFVRFCDAFNIPLVTFVDTPGFLPGVDQEYHGIIRHGAKIVYAYATATVPKISIVTRKAYGGAYVVMSSKHLGTDVTFAWPSAEIAVMGGEGAVAILYRKEIEAAADPKAARAQFADEYRRHYLTPYPAAAGGFIDEVIEPRGDAGAGHCGPRRPAPKGRDTVGPPPRQYAGLEHESRTLDPGTLVISAVGMTIVFGVLLLLWGFMAVLVRVTADARTDRWHGCNR